MQISPILVVGITLILMGAIILWRDMRKDWRRNGLLEGPGHQPFHDETDMAEVEINTAATTGAPSFKPLASSSPPAHGSELSELRATIDKAHEEYGDETNEVGPRLDSTVESWSRLEPRIDETVAAVNAVLNDVDINIARSGQNGWSFNNRGFGAFRRVFLAGESVAWLRMELTNDSRFICALRSHGDEKSALNANEAVSARALSSQRIADLISASMQPITKFAARSASRTLNSRDIAQNLWEESEMLVTQALESAGTALEESGSSLEVPESAKWDSTNKRFRLKVRVLFQKDLVANLYIDRPTPKHIECIAVPTGDGGTQSAQRQREDIEGLETLPLAEILVNCAWPSIEHAWHMKHRKGSVRA